MVDTQLIQRALGESRRAWGTVVIVVAALFLGTLFYLYPRTLEVRGQGVGASFTADAQLIIKDKISQDLVKVVQLPKVLVNAQSGYTVEYVPEWFELPRRLSVDVCFVRASMPNNATIPEHLYCQKPVEKISYMCDDHNVWTQYFSLSQVADLRASCGDTRTSATAPTPAVAGDKSDAAVYAPTISYNTTNPTNVVTNTTDMPECDQDEILVWDNSRWNCRDQATVTTPPAVVYPNCAVGEVLTSIGGVLSCVTVASGSLPPCATGQVYVYNGSAWVCQDENLLYYDESNVAPNNPPSASGSNSVAIGDGAVANGPFAMVFGSDSTASGLYAMALGTNNIASGDYSLVGGLSSTASGFGSVALGFVNSATQDGAVALGQSNASTGLYSFTVGVSNSAAADGAIAMGQNNSATASGAVALGTGNSATGTGSTVFGQGGTASGNYSVSGGLASQATNTSATAFGLVSQATGVGSSAMGIQAVAGGLGSVALGAAVNATGSNSFAIGNLSTASGPDSFTLGSQNTASTQYDFAIGQNNTTSGTVSGAIGFNNINQGNQSYILGVQNSIAGVASGSMALGVNNQILNGNSYALGNNNVINAGGGRAIGFQTSVNGTFGATIGTLSAVDGFNQTAIGSNNLISGTNIDFNTSKANDEFALILGNSDQFSGRSNAWAVSWNGAQTTYGNAGAAIAVAPANTGRMYFDDGLQKFRCSENGSAFSDCFGASAAATTANNGLTINPANNVQLGGNLIQNTNVTNNGFGLVVAGSSISTTFGPAGQVGIGGAPQATKALSIYGDLNVTGVIDPTALLFSDQTPSSYNPAIFNGYRIGVTGAVQRPVYVSGLTNSVRAFEVRQTGQFANAVFSVDTLNQKVGINNTTPQFALDITDQGSSNDSSIIAHTGIGSLGSGPTLVTSGSGIRMIWYNRKASFRAGMVNGTQWDDANIGMGSTAFGVNTIALGNNSFAAGANTTATGFTSTVLGLNTVALGTAQTVIGSNNVPSGTGVGAINPDDEAFIIGNGGVISGLPSNAFSVGWRGDSTWYGSTYANPSVVGTGKVYFDSNIGKLMCSENGGGYVPCVSSGGITNINGDVGPSYNIVGSGPISITNTPATATVGLVACAANETYTYDGSNWVCTPVSKSLIGQTSGVISNPLPLGTHETWLGELAGSGGASTQSTVFIGYNAGSGATNAAYSNFQGEDAGLNAIFASDSNFFGASAGRNASNAYNSNFLGASSGQDASNAYNSNFLGSSAGYSATNAQYSNFFGSNAGLFATNAYNSNFFGSNAGLFATNAQYSNFFGSNAGLFATDAINSNFFGTSAGYQATNARYSNFFGTQAGYQATNARYSNFFGSTAGTNATNADNSNFLGFQAGFNATNASDSNFFGRSTGSGATNAVHSIFMGANSGQNATNASGANFMGQLSGSNATNATNSNFFGFQAGDSATNASFSNFFGYTAGNGATNAQYSNFLGSTAGTNATNADNSNFFGFQAGYNATNAAYSTFIGYNAGNGATNANNAIFIGRDAGFGDAVSNLTGTTSILIGQDTHTGGFSDSIAIGRGATNTANNEFMIGGTGLATLYDIVNPKYAETRDDSGVTTPINFLYTDANGKFLSSPLASLLGLFTADNGLTKTGNNVQLGGALIQNTTITNNGFDLIFDGTGNGSSKVATFLGDIDVTGTIDPTRILFSNLAGVNSPSYNPSANSNNYSVRFQEGGNLNFQSDTTNDILHLSNSGLVGIGTGTPTYTLDVVGMMNQTAVLPGGRTNSIHSGDNVIGAGVKGVGFTTQDPVTGALGYLFAGDSTSTGGAPNQAGVGLTNFSTGQNGQLFISDQTGSYAVSLQANNGSNNVGTDWYGSTINSFVNDSLNGSSLTFEPLLLTMNNADLQLSSYQSGRDDTGSFSPLNFLYTDNTGRVLSAPTSAITSALTASNGLTRVLDDFRLGGLLTQNTTIDTAGFDMVSTQTDVDGGILRNGLFINPSTFIDTETIAGSTYYNPVQNYEVFNGIIPNNQPDANFSGLLYADGNVTSRYLQVGINNRNINIRESDPTGATGLEIVNRDMNLYAQNGAKISIQPTNVSGATVGQVLTMVGANGEAEWADLPSVANVAWALTGNSGTTAGTNFIGTTDDEDFVMKVNSQEMFRLISDAGGSGVPAFTTWDNVVTGPLSIAFGQSNTVSGGESIAWNESNTASGSFSTAFGNGSTASGYGSVAFGQNNEAFSFTETALGHYGTSYTPVSPSSINGADRLFNIGNGTGAGSESDAFTVLKNGQAGIGIDNFEANTNGNIFQVGDGLTGVIGYVDNGTGNWVAVSDERKKRNIVNLEYGLAEINALRPVSFDYKRNGEHTIGFLAQQVRGIIPEAVSGSEAEGYGMSYSTLVPAVVRGVQELSVKTDINTNSISVLLGTQTNNINTLNTAITNIQNQGDSVEEMLAALNANDQNFLTQFDALLDSVAVQQDSISELLASLRDLRLDVESLTARVASLEQNQKKELTGRVKIKKGDTKATIDFASSFSADPIITLTPYNFVDGKYAVSNLSKGGFEIKLSVEQDESVTFDWRAVEASGADSNSDSSGGSGDDSDSSDDSSSDDGDSTTDTPPTPTPEPTPETDPGSGSTEGNGTDTNTGSNSGSGDNSDAPVDSGSSDTPTE